MHEPKTDWDHIDPKDPKGYYAYFGVSPEASLSEITEAYVKVIRECSGNEFVLSEATKAYSVLSNLEKRREYDTQYSTPLTQSTPKKEDKVFLNEDESPRTNSYSGRTMGMPAEPVYDKEPHRTKISLRPDNGNGCVTWFVILMIISASLSILRLILK